MRKMIQRVLDLWFNHSHIESIIEKEKEAQKKMDERYSKIAKATINGEADWFLLLKKRDPECIMKVINTCEENNHEGAS